MLRQVKKMGRRHQGELWVRARYGVKRAVVPRVRPREKACWAMLLRERVPVGKRLGSWTG